MADNLGVQPYSNADAAIDADFGQGQVASIQRLGAQVREDMKQIFTTRQVKQFIPALTQLRPDSKDFEQQAIGLAAQYPLAMTSPIGVSALSMLGQAHKEWVAETMQNQRFAQQDKLLDTRQSAVTDNLNTRLTAQENMQRERLNSQESQTETRLKTQRELQAERLQQQEELSDRRASERETPEEREAREIRVKQAGGGKKNISAAAVKYVGEITDKMIAKKTELEKAKVAGQFFGLGKPDKALVAQLETELKALEKQVKKASSDLGLSGDSDLPQGSEPGMPGPEALIPPGAAGPQTVAQNKIEIAKRAINDPNASEAHKAAARKILGL